MEDLNRKPTVQPKISFETSIEDLKSADIEDVLWFVYTCQVKEGQFDGARCTVLEIQKVRGEFLARRKS